MKSEKNSIEPSLLFSHFINADLQKIPIGYKQFVPIIRTFHKVSISPCSLLFSSIITPFEQIFISNLQSVSPYHHNMGNWLPLTPKIRSIKVSNGNTLLIYCENYHYLCNKTCVLGQWLVYFQGSCFECQPH